MVGEPRVRLGRGEARGAAHAVAAGGPELQSLRGGRGLGEGAQEREGPSLRDPGAAAQERAKPRCRAVPRAPRRTVPRAALHSAHAPARFTQCTLGSGRGSHSQGLARDADVEEGEGAGGRGVAGGNRPRHPRDRRSPAALGRLARDAEVHLGAWPPADQPKDGGEREPVHGHAVHRKQPAPRPPAPRLSAPARGGGGEGGRARARARGRGTCLRRRGRPRGLRGRRA